MAISAGNAALQVVPVLTKNFSQQLATQMAGPAVQGSQKAGKEHGRRFGTSFSAGLRTGVGPLRTVFRGFGPGLAAAFGGAAIVSAIKSVTDEARESAIVGRQTAAVLKSTGGAANISAKQVGNLATALSNKTGADDEAIQSSQNLLLTFTGIRNEAGKGNDVFNQSSAAILDMTASMNRGEITAQGLKASTIQVGKALNDPIKGMTALSRVGVTFTEGQKAQVKAMVESGDKLGAQKLILAELRKEFGGSAAASADAGKRFGVFVGNLKEQIGTALLPIMNRLLGFLVDKLPGALATVGGWFSKVRLGVLALGAAFSGEGVTSDGFVGVMEHIGVALRGVWDWVRKTAATLSAILVPAFHSIVDAIRPAIAAFVSGILPGLKTLGHVVLTQVWPALKVLGIVIGVTLYAALRFVVPFILRLAGPVLGFLFKQLGQTIQWIANVVRFIGRLGAWFLRWITGARTTGDAVAELGRRVGRFAANMSKQWQSIVRSVTGALGFLKRTSITVLSFMIRLWLRWAGSIIDAAAAAMGWVPGIGPKLRRAQTKFHEFAAGVNRALDKIKPKKVSVTADASIHTTNQTRQALNALGIKGYGTRFLAVGGPVRGPGTGTSDSIPAMLSNDEHVWTAQEVRKAGGHRAVEAMRKEVRGYASGGPVVNIRMPRGNPGGFSDVAVRAIGKIGQVAADKLAGVVGAKLSKLLANAATSALGGGTGPGGWQWQMRVLRAAFPGLALISGFRPGAITSTGNRSYHSMGRAVDVPPRWDVFNWIATNYGKRTRELIYTPAGNRQIKNGQHHVFTGGTIRQDHYNHVHWAYDKGGMLPPGRTLAVNNTGRSELVLPAQLLGSSFRKSLQSWVVPWLKRIAVAVEGGRAGRAGGGGGGGGAPKKAAPWWAKYGASVDYGTVSQRTWDALYVAGWRGRPGDHAERFYRPASFDQGGWLQPGMVGVNTGTKAERVVGPHEQLIDERGLARMVGRAVAQSLRDNPPAVYLDRQKVSRGVADGALWERRR